MHHALNRDNEIFLALNNWHHNPSYSYNNVAQEKNVGRCEKECNSNQFLYYRFSFYLASAWCPIILIILPHNDSNWKLLLWLLLQLHCFYFCHWSCSDSVRACELCKLITIDFLQYYLRIILHLKPQINDYELFGKSLPTRLDLNKGAHLGYSNHALFIWNQQN